MEKLLCELRDEAKDYRSSEEFHCLLKAHLTKIKRQLTDLRKLAVRYCKKELRKLAVRYCKKEQQATREVINVNKFALYIRVSRWRDSVEKLL